MENEEKTQTKIKHKQSGTKETITKRKAKFKSKESKNEERV